MIVVTFVDRVDGPIFKKVRTILSTCWPIQFGDKLAISEEHFRVLFHQKGIKDWRVETIIPQDYAERKVESLAYALASEFVFYGCSQIAVRLETGKTFLDFMTPNGEYYMLKVGLESFEVNPDRELPKQLQDLLDQHYAELI